MRRVVILVVRPDARADRGNVVERLTICEDFHLDILRGRLSWLTLVCVGNQDVTVNMFTPHDYNI
eukprot:8942277-Heterocapsa_arctica.AAC.1